MARIDSITIGKGQGSLGNVTLRKTKDGTIASQKISKGTQKIGTYRQTVRRVMLSNLVNAYKDLLALTDEGLKVAFTRKPTNESDFNAFVRMNMAKASVSDVKLVKEEAAAGMVCPAPFIITDGALLAPQSLQDLYTSGTINLGAGLTLNNLGDLSQLLVNGYGCKQGDTMTFLTMVLSELNFAFHVKQFQIDVNSTANLPSWVTASGVISLETATFATACVVIRGRSENGKFEVSPSEFSDDVMTSADYAEHITKTYESLAVTSYGYKASPFLQIPVTEANAPAHPESVTLTFALDPPDGGRYEVNGEDQPVDTPVPVPYGSEVNLHFEAADNYTFAGWKYREWEDPDVAFIATKDETIEAIVEAD